MKTFIVILIMGMCSMVFAGPRQQNYAAMKRAERRYAIKIVRASHNPYETSTNMGSVTIES